MPFLHEIEISGHFLCNWWFLDTIDGLKNTIRATGQDGTRKQWCIRSENIASFARTIKFLAKNRKFWNISSKKPMSAKNFPDIFLGQKIAYNHAHFF